MRGSSHQQLFIDPGARYKTIFAFVGNRIIVEIFTFRTSKPKTEQQYKRYFKPLESIQHIHPL